MHERYFTEGQPGFEPPKARAFDEKKLGDRYTWVEPKIDGARALVFCTPEGVVITSRRKNKDGVHRQWQDNLPHIRDMPGLKEFCKEGELTIFDGEIVMSSLSSTMSVVGAGPSTAIEYQRQHGWAKLIVFDCPVYIGCDVSESPLHYRRHLCTIPALGEHAEVIEFSDYAPSSITAGLQHMIHRGFEGAVLKDPNSGYFDRHAWLKYKKAMSIDAVVTGYVVGKGKYLGTVGALRASVYNEKHELQEICRVAPGDDLERNRWKFDLEAGVGGQIIEIECQEWGAQSRLRHPRIIRRRLDKSSPNTVDFSGETPRIIA